MIVWLTILSGLLVSAHFGKEKGRMWSEDLGSLGTNEMTPVSLLDRSAVDTRWKLSAKRNNLAYLHATYTVLSFLACIACFECVLWVCIAWGATGPDRQCISGIVLVWGYEHVQCCGLIASTHQGTVPVTSLLPGLPPVASASPVSLGTSTVAWLSSLLGWTAAGLGASASRCHWSKDQTWVVVEEAGKGKEQ